MSCNSSALVCRCRDCGWSWLFLSAPWAFEKDCTGSTFTAHSLRKLQRKMPSTVLGLSGHSIWSHRKSNTFKKNSNYHRKHDWFCHWCLRNENAKRHAWKPPARLLLLEYLVLLSYLMWFVSTCLICFSCLLCYVCLFLQFSTAWNYVYSF